jgi:uncharacterized membrane protein YhaH (DUF805 family)
MGLLNLFFSLQGRIGRGRFWLGLVGLSIISTALAAYLLSEVFGQSYDALQPAALAKPAQQLMALVSVILLYPLLAVVAKRLHDRGRSAWGGLPVVLAGLLPAATVLSGLAGRVGDVLAGRGSPLEIVGVALYGLLLLVVVIDLGLLPGQAGVNRFGPDPRAR